MDHEERNQKVLASGVMDETRPKDQEAGVSAIEAMMAIWGKRGRQLVIGGLALFLLLFELDNSTIFIYQNYAMSDLKALSSYGALLSATFIIYVVTKPFVAKISNVIGRGQTLAIAVGIYILSYILMTASQNMKMYAAGVIFYSIAQSSTAVMFAIIISDITTPRCRGLAVGISYLPFLVLPWVSGPLVNSVVHHGGIGWRWGIGIYATLMPCAASLLIFTLLIYERRANKQGLITRTNHSVRSFCSEIDLGGLFLFMTGSGCLLLPISLAANQSKGWGTPWIISLIAIGVICLVALPIYEKYMASHPVAPPAYFKNRTICFTLILMAADAIAFQCTHTYLYAWATISHGFPTTLATYYVYMNGAMQCLAGIGAGAFMQWTGRYKWLVVAGAAVRLLGYGLMIRLRGQHNSKAELFGQQVIQGLGSGILLMALFVPAQTLVPHTERAQVVALIYSFTNIGGSIGNCVAGAVYTSAFRRKLYDRLGNLATPELVETLFQSITGKVPVWDSPQRIAINYAYSDIIRLLTYVALATSIPVLILCFYLPNLSLPEDGKFNVVEQDVSDHRSQGGTEMKKLQSG